MANSNLDAYVSAASNYFTAVQGGNHKKKGKRPPKGKAVQSGYYKGR